MGRSVRKLYIRCNHVNFAYLVEEMAHLSYLVPFFFPDLSKLGGLSVLVGQLNHPDTDIRKISAWILGKASQNNPLVQKQVHYYYYFLFSLNL